MSFKNFNQKKIGGFTSDNGNSKVGRIHGTQYGTVPDVVPISQSIIPPDSIMNGIPLNFRDEVVISGGDIKTPKPLVEQWKKLQDKTAAQLYTLGRLGSKGKSSVNVLSSEIIKRGGLPITINNQKSVVITPDIPGFKPLRTPSVVGLPPATDNDFFDRVNKAEIESQTVLTEKGGTNTLPRGSSSTAFGTPNVFRRKQFREDFLDFLDVPPTNFLRTPISSVKGRDFDTTSSAVGSDFSFADLSIDPFVSPIGSNTESFRRNEAVRAGEREFIDNKISEFREQVSRPL